MNVRISKQKKIKIANSEDVFKIMQQVLLRENRLHRRREHFWTIGLTLQNSILYIELVALGATNRVMVDPLEVFSFASQKKAHSLILVHNHPGNTMKASKEDIALTKMLKKGADTLHIKILDHIIISETGYFSFLDAGIMERINK